jgi:hypothetical protein
MAELGTRGAIERALVGNSPPTAARAVFLPDKGPLAGIVAEVNLDLIRMLRDGFLFFRDRRPEMYGSLLKMTG